MSKLRTTTGWIMKTFFHKTNQDSVMACTQEDWQMFNSTWKCFSILNNRPSARQVALLTKEFLTYYFCSYYCFMFRWIHHSAVILAYENHQFIESLSSLTIEYGKLSRKTLSKTLVFLLRPSYERSTDFYNLVTFHNVPHQVFWFLCFVHSMKDKKIWEN